METNPNKAWEVHEESDGWYYYTEYGKPRGPFMTKEDADYELDDYGRGTWE